MSASPAALQSAPPQALVSTRFVARMMMLTVALATATAGISLAGRWYGKHLATAGYTISEDRHDIFIGEDHLRIPSNVIRFAEQRLTGTAERIDMSLTWPRLQGYTEENRGAFTDITHPGGLIFLQISQSTMSRDMSGRLEPIYRHIFAGPPISFGSGLSQHRLKYNSGYGNEVFFTARSTGQADYVVRCILPDADTPSTSADCQRDIKVGKDLAVLYRFSSQLLPQWQAIDEAVAGFVSGRLVP